MLIIEQSVTLLSHTEEPEILLERAGRTCYKSEDKITAESAPKFVEMICQRNHESVLEHAVATIVFTTDRGITHELVRHRIASFSQESTRYVNYHKKGEIRVVKPLGMLVEQSDIWTRAMQAAEAGYNALIASGCTPEVARDVLPTCTAADIVVTANFREWKHILKLRTSKAAHPKIRALMSQARLILRGISPTVFKAEVSV
jgi:thymidylate synthase (FAD)